MGLEKHVGKGSIGETAGDEFPLPWIAGRGFGALLPVFGNETLEQLPNRFPVAFISRQFVRVRDRQGSPFARCFDAGTAGVGGG